MTQTINRDRVTRGEYKIKHKLLIYYSVVKFCRMFSLKPLKTLEKRYGRAFFSQFKLNVPQSKINVPKWPFVLILHQILFADINEL